MKTGHKITIYDPEKNIPYMLHYPASYIIKIIFF